MADKWITKGRYRCMYCNVNLYDNAPSIQKHNDGVKHKENVAKYMENLYAKKQEETKESDAAAKELARIEAITGGGGGPGSAGVKVEPLPSKSTPISNINPRAPKPFSKPSHPNDDQQTEDTTTDNGPGGVYGSWEDTDEQYESLAGEEGEEEAAQFAAQQPVNEEYEAIQAATASYRSEFEAGLTGTRADIEAAKAVGQYDDAFSSRAASASVAGRAPANIAPAAPMPTGPRPVDVVGGIGAPVRKTAFQMSIKLGGSSSNAGTSSSSSSSSLPLGTSGSQASGPPNVNPIMGSSSLGPPEATRNGAPSNPNPSSEHATIPPSSDLIKREHPTPTSQPPDEPKPSSSGSLFRKRKRQKA